jgi:hypothetical protein
LIRSTLILDLITPELNSGVSDVSRGGTNSISEVEIVGCLAINLDLLASDPLASIRLAFSDMNCSRALLTRSLDPVSRTRLKSRSERLVNVTPDKMHYLPCPPTLTCPRY